MHFALIIISQDLLSEYKELQTRYSVVVSDPENKSKIQHI